MQSGFITKFVPRALVSYVRNVGILAGCTNICSYIEYLDWNFGLLQCIFPKKRWKHTSRFVLQWPLLANPKATSFNLWSLVVNTQARPKFLSPLLRILLVLVRHPKGKELVLELLLLVLLFHCKVTCSWRTRQTTVFPFWCNGNTLILVLFVLQERLLRQNMKATPSLPCDSLRYLNVVWQDSLSVSAGSTKEVYGWNLSVPLGTFEYLTKGWTVFVPQQPKPGFQFYRKCGDPDLLEETCPPLLWRRIILPAIGDYTSVLQVTPTSPVRHVQSQQRSAVILVL